MKHSPSVRIHQMEASHARVLLDILEMELRDRVLVSESRTWPISFFSFVHIPCYLDIDECTMNTHNCDETLAECSNTPNGSFTCTCDAGYTGNGTTGTCIGERISKLFIFVFVFCSRAFLFSYCLLECCCFLGSYLVRFFQEEFVLSCRACFLMTSHLLSGVSPNLSLRCYV